MASIADEKARVLVTPSEFARAETDMYFGVVVAEGGFGAFSHHREPMAIDHQTVVRANRDTLYSSAVFDLDAGPVTITLPDAAGRFISMQLINEDHYVAGVVYGSGSYTIAREQIGTRYVLVGVRTLIDPRDAADLARVHALQDAFRVEQPHPGRFEVPAWDRASQKKVRDALIALGETVPDSKGMFGARGDVDPVRHLIGTAIGWGGNPERDAIYLIVTPSQNDAKTVHELRVADVPVDAFWSISVYNADGYFEPNERDAYTLNNLTATPEPDGSFMIRFGRVH